MIRFPRRFIDPQNQYRRWIDPRVRALRLAEVIRYLEQRGWVRTPSDHPGCFVYQEPPGHEVAGRPYYQFVPDSEQGGDYPLRMFELLTGLAEFENRQASEVIDDVVGASDRTTNGAAAHAGQEAGQASPSPVHRSG